MPPFRLPPPQNASVDLLLVAGEHSGDQQAAALVRQLKPLAPGLAIAALGGPALAGAGVQVLHDMTATSVVGLVEVLKNIRHFRAVFNATLDWITTHRPRAVCLVDYPGFNLRLAAELRKRGLSRKGGGKIAVLYYISPQIWAWKARRRFTMARDLDALATIFPFEPKCYADTTLPVEFVGHPFLDPAHRPIVRHAPDAPVLLLPGSRKQAVARIFPALLAGYQAAVKTNPRDAVVLHPSDEIKSILQARDLPETVRLRQAAAGQAAGEPVAASAVLTSSGTMQLHCALAGIPGAIAYRANPLTYQLGRRLVKIPWLGITNILLGEPMYPEYLQGAATPEALARELDDCLRNPARLEKTRGQAARLRRILSHPTGSTPAAWLLRRMG